MMALNMGIEAAMLTGLPPAANGNPAGPAAAANAGSKRPAGRAEVEGPASFRSALRAAGKNDRAGAALSCPSSTPPPSPNETAPASAIDAIGDLTDAQTAEGDMPPEAAERVERIGRMQPFLEGDPANASALIRQVVEPIARATMSAGGSAAPRAEEVPADLSGLLRDALPAAASPPSAVEEGSTAAQTLEGADAAGGFTLPGLGSATGRQTVDVAELVPLVRRLSAQLPMRDAAPPASEAADGSRTDPAAASTAAGLTTLSDATDVRTAGASVLRATPHPEGARGPAAPEPVRPVDPSFDHVASAPETRQEASAESGGFGQAADDGLFAKSPATANVSAGKEEAASDAFALAARELRPSQATEGISERSGEAPSALRDQEAPGGSGRAGVFDQIVQRAAVQLRSEQSEINIDLKPDFLGRVRMQILTENQQVTVRIVTELSSVRDMIETGLHQLKSELQSQGLQVARIEVAVADDHPQQGWQQAHTAQAWKAAVAGEVSTGDRPSSEERSEALHYRPRSGGTTSIDMFV